MGKVKFKPEDFEKKEKFTLTESDFAKQDVKIVRVDLTWVGSSLPPNCKADLDVCAFLLDSDDEIAEENDVVCFRSKRRWLTKRDFKDPNFDPLDGKVSLWTDHATQTAFEGSVGRWKEKTLPLSSDGSVIGSWDDATDDDEEEQCGETMHVLIDNINCVKYKKIVLAAVVAMKEVRNGVTFSNIKDAKVTMSDADDGSVLASYDLNSQFKGKDAVCFAELVYDERNYIWNVRPRDDSYNGGIFYLAMEVF